MRPRSGWSCWVWVAAIAAVAVPAAAQTEPVDPGVPPIVTVTPVAPGDPGATAPAESSGIVTPPIVVPNATTAPANPTPPQDAPAGGTTSPAPAASPASGPAATGTQPLPPPAAAPGAGPADLPPPATNTGVEPAPLPAPAGTAGVSDPGWTHAGPVPVARPLRDGDVYAHFPGYGGLFSVQYGINGDADVGGGLTFFTLSLTAKYAFYHNDYLSVAAFAEIAFPFYKSFWPMSAAGMEYMMFIGLGPLFSLWNDLAELDAGLLLIPSLFWPAEECFDDMTTADTTDQVCRTNPYDTDLVVMPYVYGSIALAGFARLLLGFEHFAVTALDSFSCPEGSTVDPAGVCRDNSTHAVTELERSDAEDVNVPALLLGIRFHGQRFVADIGLHFPMSDLWWDHPVGQYMIFIPSASFGYLW
ncbi:MAG: hypothetical protein GYA57_16510 [Myxococcales bacterium]|nr:hypothetical protein [Myxococcales bacterium]